MRMSAAHVAGCIAAMRSLCVNDMALLQAGEAAMQPVAQAVGLRGLKLHLGPELRAIFPVVLNMGISGDVELHGTADPAGLRVAGAVHLDGGEVNLVATQLVLDREHANRAVFTPSRGLDPLLDLRLRGAEARAAAAAARMKHTPCLPGDKNPCAMNARPLWISCTGPCNSFTWIVSVCFCGRALSRQSGLLGVARRCRR